MALDPNKWTLKTQEAFSAAVEQAKSLNNPEVTVDHLLAALLRQTDGVAFTHFAAADVVRHPLFQRIVQAYEAHSPDERA